MECQKETKPICPHCGQEMSTCELPPYNFSDGLGWGSTFLYICFNDECSLYAEGWESMMNHYGQKASYRCMCNPVNMEIGALPVYSRDALKGGAFDEAEQRAAEEAEKKAKEDLKHYLESGDSDNILKILLNESMAPQVRLSAAEMLGQIGEVKVIEPIKHHVFGNQVIRDKANQAIKQIHKTNFTKECPYCAEIIKARAVVCKICNRDLVQKKPS